MHTATARNRACVAGFVCLPRGWVLFSQHPLQILLIFLSNFESSSRIAASLGIEGPGVVIPSMRPRAPDRPFDPFAVELVLLGVPVELAVPRALVPGAVGTFCELPAPLGSFPELFRPPAFAGPLGTPLTAAVPAPAEPASGEPTAELVPVDGPLAAPPVELPPPDPLPDWATTGSGAANIVRISIIRTALQQSRMGFLDAGSIAATPA